MDRLLQQRLLGAAILLAILVLVVPELLDGAGHRSRYPTSLEIPPAPSFKPMPEVEPLPIVQPDISAQPVPEAALAASAAVSPAASIVVPVEKPATVVAAPSVVTPAAKPAAAKTAVTKSAVKPAWALQVGSFSEKNNALSLRDQFRSKGYAAYVDEDSGSFRVRIGPELDRTRIEKTLDKVRKQEKIKGMIVTHP